MSDETKELQSYSPHGLISQALAQNVPIETLERLMDLQERWQSGQAKSEFLKSMSEFQSKVPELIKSKKVDFPSKTGGNVKYNYTPLSKISKAIQPILKECGLSYRWEFEEANDKIKCICIISHVAGHSEKNSMVAGKDTTGNKNDIQSIGSTRQYLQRYTLIGVLGLSTADQDNEAQTSNSGKKEIIPEPEEKKETKDYSPEIKKCLTIEKLKEVWDSIPKEEQSKYLKLKDSIKANIKKEGGK